MTTWLTSDLHIGHANIIRYCNRPFADVGHMNAELLRRWRERVMPHDVVWVLGDVAMGSIEQSLDLVAALPGEKHLVAGNHDRCWPGNGRRAPRWVERYERAGFVEIVTETAIDLGEGVILPGCHFPYVGDSHGDDRYTSWRPVDHGEWLLHGHVHDSWQVLDRQINVAVDVWDYAPVDAATVRALVGARPSGRRRPVRDDLDPTTGRATPAMIAAGAGPGAGAVAVAGLDGSAPTARSMRAGWWECLISPTS